MIEAKNIYKRFGKNQVLKGLNLTINTGETVVILGRSGVGKSVLLRQILGIDFPDEGSVFIDKQCMSKANKSTRHALRKNMGMLFQAGALFDSMTIKENIAFSLRQHQQLSEKEITERVKQALDMVDLHGVMNKMPSDLSGGMKKRAALARVIVYRPHIVLYDEPTTGLDPITSMHINNLINMTKKELNATSVVVTHDMQSALVVGDRLAFHHGGKIPIIAPPEEFLHHKDPELKDFLKNALTSKEELLEARKGGLKR